MFYVLKGRGHDIHDGRHIEWKAGDVMIVECGCVHQHFNDDPDNEAILLVFKAKPLFLFMHLLFQKIVSYPPNEASPGPRGLPPAEGSVTSYRASPACACGGARRDAAQLGCRAQIAIAHGDRRFGDQDAQLWTSAISPMSATRPRALRAEDVAASRSSAKIYEAMPNVVNAEDMPWESSPTA